jgi:hypothetical protein
MAFSGPALGASKVASRPHQDCDAMTAADQVTRELEVLRHAGLIGAQEQLVEKENVHSRRNG